MTATWCMVECEVDKRSARAGSARGGQEHHPAQLTGIAPIHQRRAANGFAVPFGKPHSAAAGSVKLRLGDGLGNKGAEGFAKAVTLDRVTQAVQVNDQLVVARSPVMSELDWSCPHAVRLKGKLSG